MRQSRTIQSSLNCNSKLFQYRQGANVYNQQPSIFSLKLSCHQINSCFYFTNNEVTTKKKSNINLSTTNPKLSKVRQSSPLYRHRGSVQAVRPIGGVEVYLYPFMTTVLEGGEGSVPCPGRSLPLGKTRYPLYRRLGGPQDRSGQVQKISPPLGFNPRTVQPIASRYTDYATRPTNTEYLGYKPEPIWEEIGTLLTG
jgi:hypothetical protein